MRAFSGFQCAIRFQPPDPGAAACRRARPAWRPGPPAHGFLSPQKDRCTPNGYGSTQPPMPRKFREATVKKRKEKFGAPTPDAQFGALVDYLPATCGTQETRRP